MYDVAIVGGGPAGAAAAINLSIRKLSFVMLSGAKVSRKLVSAREIPNYPGMPGVSGEALAAAFEDHLRRADVDLKIKTIDHIYDMGGYYALTSGDEMWEAKSVILTTGVMSQRPIEGEEALVGQGVSYCATCDGALYKGGHVAVIAYEEGAVHEAEYLSGMMKVTFIQASPKAGEARNVRMIRGEKPVRILRDGRGVMIQTDKQEIRADCAFIFRNAIAPGTLLAGLQTENGHVAVSRDLSTNLPGVFAAGDITGTPYQIAKAVGEGATAALNCAVYVAGLKTQEN